jgi:nucleoside-diphosphate-sugar epimerase
MRIVVFGAGGFVGGWICEELAEGGGCELLACLRAWTTAPRLARRGIDIAQVDLGDKDKLLPLVSGADVVVNAALPPADRESELAAGLYTVSAQAGVRRFVQLSSAVVYGNRLGEVAEDAPVAPASDYARGKAETERRLLWLAAESGPQLFILRPSIIYGPFSETWTIRYALRIAKKKWKSLGPAGVGTCNLVHAHDLARAVRAAAETNVTSGSHVLNINGPDVVSWNEYIDRFGGELGIADRTTPNYLQFVATTVAGELVRSGARWNWMKSIYRSMRKDRAVVQGVESLARLHPKLQELGLLRMKVRYSWERAARVLGFRPTISLNEGLRQSAEWCRIHGVL